MSSPQVNRITFADNKIRAFSGRTKLDEIDLGPLDLSQFKNAVTQVEKQLVKLDWLPEGDARTWRSAPSSKAFGKDLTSVRGFCEKLLTNPEAVLPAKRATATGRFQAASPNQSNKPKSDKPLTERQQAHADRVAFRKKETAEKKVRREEEKAARKAERVKKAAERAAAPKDGNRMHITPEQRKRKTLRLSVEDALDAHVIDLVKSRRMLRIKDLEAVAKENGITPKGKDNGHIKMNVQNQIRSKFVSEQPVFIGGKKHIISEKELAAYAASLEKDEDEGEE